MHHTLIIWILYGKTHDSSVNESCSIMVQGRRNAQINERVTQHDSLRARRERG